MELAALQKVLGDMCGFPVWGMHLAASMLTLQLGPPRVLHQRRGPREVGELALHVQSDWVWLRGGASLLSSHELFGLEPSDRSPALRERVGLYVPDAATPVAPHIRNAAVNSDRALRIDLDDDLVLIVKSPSVGERPDAELWRLMRAGAEHYVICADGIDLVEP